MRNKDYYIVKKTDSKNLAEFLCKDGQLLLPPAKPITDTEMALDEPIDLAGRLRRCCRSKSGCVGSWAIRNCGFWRRP